MNKKKFYHAISSSFRDPNGYVFYKNGILFRQINNSYKENYDLLMKSGLYKELTDKKLLIAHKEISQKSDKKNSSAYKIIRPEIIPFISYPYEWCFSELKDAALTTLKIQKTALKYNMSLKDSSAYNIQFANGSPIMIDTLSFEKFNNNLPWIAYQQFCRHFIAPIALLSYNDARLNQLSKIYIDGIPLDLTSSLLPLKSKFKFGIAAHIHLHSKSQIRYENTSLKKIEPRFVSKTSMFALIDNLQSTVGNLKLNIKKTSWSDYNKNNNYSENSITDKKNIITKFIKKIKPSMVWDIGANDGLFSRIPANIGIKTVSFDIDPICVENNYLQCKSTDEKNILPLVIDITNPSPAIGWDNTERFSLSGRASADCVMALALIHHLAIGNNLSLEKIAEFLSKICKNLIIEFIPKSDSQVQRLLTNRNDIFIDYNQNKFKTEFKKYFKIIEAASIRDSERVIYLMKV